MSDSSGDEYAIPLRIDTSQAHEDLRGLDPDVEHLKEQFRDALNQDIGSKTLSPTFDNALDRAKRGGLVNVAGTPTPQLRAESPQAAAVLTELNRLQRAQATAQVRQGLPSVQQQQQAIPATQPGQQGKPVEITARPTFFRMMAEAGRSAIPARAVTDMAMGNTVSMQRTLRSGAAALVQDAPEVAAALGAISSVVAIAGAVSQQQAAFERQATVTASNLAGNPTTALGNDVNDQLRAAGQPFALGPDQSIAVGQQLAHAGVPTSRVTPLAEQQFALASHLGTSPDDQSLTRLTTSLSVQGGLNVDQLSTVYQSIASIGKVGGQSAPAMQRLVDALSSLVTATGMANVSITGLAAVQSRLGSAYNAGQVLAPAVGATGLGAVQQAGLLGMSADQFGAAQRRPDVLFRALGQYAARIDTTHDRQGAELAAGIMQQNGMVNLTGLSNDKQVEFIGDLLSGRTGAAERLTGQYQQRLTPPQPRRRGQPQAHGVLQTPRQFVDTSIPIRAAQVGLLDQVGVDVQNLWRGGLEAIPHASDALTSLPGKIPEMLGDTLAAPDFGSWLFGWNPAPAPRPGAATPQGPGHPGAPRRPGAPVTPTAPSIFDPLAPIGDAIGGLASGIGSLFSNYNRATADPRHVVGSNTIPGAGTAVASHTQRLELIVRFVDDASGRTVGTSTTTHTLTPTAGPPLPQHVAAISRVNPARQVVGGWSHKPPR